MRANAISRVPRGLGIGVLLLTGAAACGEPAVPGLSPSPLPEGSTTRPTTVGVPPATPTPTPTHGPTVTGSGTIIEGLRPTCRVLDTPEQRFALVGPGTARLTEGDRVTVTGAQQSGAHNPCGVTFVVTRIRSTTSGG